MSETIIKEYTLDEAACDMISKDIYDYCKNIGIDNKTAIGYRLSAELCLLYWIKEGLRDSRVILSSGRLLLRPYLTVEVEGKSFNPYSENDDDFGLFSDSILVRMGIGPEYSYDKGFNRIKIRLKKKSPGQIKTLFCVMAAAVVVGMAGNALLPANALTGIVNSFITPVYDAFFNILGCIAGPMIFLSVAWGVYGIGDVATLGRIGKKMMQRFVCITLVATALFSVFFPVLGPGLSTDLEQNGHFDSIAELVLGILPSTIIEPFANGNILQIIFLGFAMGITLLYLGKQTSMTAKAIEQGNLIVQFMMELISKLVPYVIFLVILNMAWSDSLHVLLTAWKLLLALIAAFAIASMLFIIETSIRRKVSPIILIKKSLPTFLVGLTTASSAAAFSSNVNTCENSFGVDRSLIMFGIPLGMVMHKPISAIYNLLLLFFFASKYDVSCSLSWICIAVFISAVIAIATPPIPGGGAVAYSILFTQMGIPEEAMAIALALDILTDFLITACEMLVLPLSLVNSAAVMGMIDEDILREPVKAKA